MPAFAGAGAYSFFGPVCVPFMACLSMLGCMHLFHLALYTPMLKVHATLTYITRFLLNTLLSNGRSTGREKRKRRRNKSKEKKRKVKHGTWRPPKTAHFHIHPPSIPIAIVQHARTRCKVRKKPFPPSETPPAPST
ncbi:hypothetical protein ACJQWK_11444 [Exserohilum turcicum]